jgi:ABC-type uncharacterized transport system permease subunit
LILGNPDIWVLTVSAGVPIAYASLGGIFSERGGVVNIALEGLMLMSAFFAVVGSYVFQDAWVGLALGVASGIVLAALLAFGAIWLLADHVVLGMGVNLLALGLTTYLLNGMYGYNGTPINTPSLPTFDIPGLRDIPVIGQALAEQSVLVYVFVAVLAASQYALFHTVWGLHLRAVGEDPWVARGAGLNPRRLKLIGVLISGALAGLGGAYLSIGVLNQFTSDMTDGRGFIALAAVIFGGWKPLRATLASLIFGFAFALSTQLQGSAVPNDLLLTLPYLLTVAAVAGIIGRTQAPMADGLAYEEEVSSL